MSADAYFYLAHFLGAYLHQDYVVVSGSIEGAIDDFLTHEPRYCAWGLRADLERFLSENPQAPLAAFNQTFPGAFHIGDGDADARAWLDRVRARVAAKLD
jgi:hypothetical protein